MSKYNPIVSVNGSSIPCPSSYQWDEQDVSASDAGRTEDGLMHKKLIAKKVAVSLSWQNVDTATASKVLQAFNSEYFSVKYLDPKAGENLTKTFYVGDRSAPLYNCRLNVWSNITLKIIER